MRGWQAFLAVEPQALPLAIPVGLAFAFAVGPSAAPTVRVYKVMLLTAFVASLLSFGVMAWGMPAGNQAFRELAFQAETRKAQRTGGGALENALRKGANEMTLSELRREIRNVANVDEQRRYSWTFHLHFTLPAAALAIAVFMVLVPVDGRLLRGLLAFAACFVYWALIFAGEFGVRRDYLMPVLGAWLPNLAFVTVAVLIGLSRSRQFLSAAQG